MKNYTQFNESKVASNDSPLGFYTIANALMPIELFEKLDKDLIKYTHDEYRNYIIIYVKDIEEGINVRNYILDEMFEADDIDEDEVQYHLNDPNDVLEIKLLQNG